MKKLIQICVVMQNVLLGYNPEPGIEGARVREESIRLIEKKMDLKCVAEIGGMIGDVQLIGAKFQHNGELSIKEARKLLVDSTQIFIQQVNQDEKLRPYLRNFPATEQHIEVGIFIRQLDGNFLGNNQLKFVVSSKGYLYYWKDGNEGGLSEDYTPPESYSDAKVIVYKSKP